MKTYFDQAQLTPEFQEAYELTKLDELENEIFRLQVEQTYSRRGRSADPNVPSRYSRFDRIRNWIADRASGSGWVSTGVRVGMAVGTFGLAVGLHAVSNLAGVPADNLNNVLYPALTTVAGYVGGARTAEMINKREVAVPGYKDETRKGEILYQKMMYGMRRAEETDNYQQRLAEYDQYLQDRALYEQQRRDPDVNQADLKEPELVEQPKAPADFDSTEVAEALTEARVTYNRNRRNTYKRVGAVAGLAGGLAGVGVGSMQHHTAVSSQTPSTHTVGSHLPSGGNHPHTQPTPQPGIDDQPHVRPHTSITGSGNTGVGHNHQPAAFVNLNPDINIHQYHWNYIEQLIAKHHLVGKNPWDIMSQGMDKFYHLTGHRLTYRDMGRLPNGNLNRWIVNANGTPMSASQSAFLNQVFGSMKF